jgi:hypothetical protein
MAWSVLFGGELSADVAQRLVEGARAPLSPYSAFSSTHTHAFASATFALTGPLPGAKDKSLTLTAEDMAGFKKLKIDTEETKIIFILQVCAGLS